MQQGEHSRALDGNLLHAPTDRRRRCERGLTELLHRLVELTTKRITEDWLPCVLLVLPRVSQVRYLGWVTGIVMVEKPSCQSRTKHEGIYKWIEPVEEPKGLIGIPSCTPPRITEN